MDDGLFDQLDQMSARIDVLIDEEAYDQVVQILRLARPRNRRVRPLSDFLEPCFSHPTCTREEVQASAWQELWRQTFALNPNKTSSRKSFSSIWASDSDIGKILREDTDKSKSSPQDRRQQFIVGYWSLLFLAKLIRAGIQQKGTDCYFGRLDEMLALLENILPRPEMGDHKDNLNMQITKLAVIYLLELSSSSIGYEMLGFAQRARRLIADYLSDLEGFPQFYDLLARYNIGVAYFHESSYKKAVLEFNEIIRKTEEANGGNQFFNLRSGNDLLYLPSVLYRADVQLKLQLAYHSLRTLVKRFPDEKVSDYKAIRARLIRVEAYVQMGDLNRCRGEIREIYEKLFSQTGQGSSDCIPSVKAGDFRQNIKGRFVGLLTAHYLARLDNHIRRLTSNADRTHKPRRFTLHKHLGNLTKGFAKTYFDAVRYGRSDRQGYFEQAASYLKLLASAQKASPKIWVDGEKVSRNLASLAFALFRQRRKQILQINVIQPTTCAICSKIAVELDRLRDEHFQMFTSDMLVFFESKAAARNKYVRRDKEDFVKELIRIERESRNDLRIHDLELRYRSKHTLDQLDERYATCSQCFIDLDGNSKSDKEKAFADLLACVSGYNQPDLLNASNYEKIMGDWHSHSFDQIKQHSVHEGQANSLHFVGLQRWNSSSPAQGRSVGGGYLIYRTDKNCRIDLGIVIDPGFDFVRNLFRMGFSLSDIDIVLLSHAHADHVHDFESIILLLFELKKRANREKRLNVVLTLGIYKRLEYIIKDPTFRYYIEPYVIDIDREIEPGYFERLPTEQIELNEGGQSYTCTPDVSFKFISTGRELPLRYRAIGSRENHPVPDAVILPTRAYHDDQSGYSDSFGFKMQLSVQSEKRFTFGYTGDTKWVYPSIEDLLEQDKREITDIGQQYKDCDAVLVHLGSLITPGSGTTVYDFSSYKPPTQSSNCSPECEKLVRDKGHPYLVGMLRLLSTICSVGSRQDAKKRPLVLLSEFGEELGGGIRVDFCNRLAKAYGATLDFMPVDVGMDICLWNPAGRDIRQKETPESLTVWCAQCDQFVSVHEADFERYGQDEAIFCICKTCRKATPQNVLQDRLRRLYEVGRELRTTP